MASVWKAITAKKLLRDKVRLAALNALRKQATPIRADFRETVKTWKRKPKFETKVSLAGSRMTVTVYTTDPIYGYVDKGTKPHVIRPVKAKALHFVTGYSAKTTPRVIGSREGGADGDEVFTKEVQHPGTKAREFDKIIARKWQRKFRSEMSKFLKDIAEASGHAR